MSNPTLSLLTELESVLSSAEHAITSSNVPSRLPEEIAEALVKVRAAMEHPQLSTEQMTRLAELVTGLLEGHDEGQIGNITRGGCFEDLVELARPLLDPVDAAAGLYKLKNREAEASKKFTPKIGEFVEWGIVERDLCSAGKVQIGRIVEIRGYRWYVEPKDRMGTSVPVMAEGFPRPLSQPDDLLFAFAVYAEEKAKAARDHAKKLEADAAALKRSLEILDAAR